jgi:hypothetical protein
MPPWREFRLCSAASALVLIAICAVICTGSPPESKEKTLIEFGWDEPDTAFLGTHLAELERTPFDGCVFHAVARSADGKIDDLAWKAWSRRAFRKEELAQAFDDLKGMRPTRFTKNLIRLNTTPADLDWFDDHAAIVANARLVAELAREGKCLGVLLDTEQYQGPLFNYAKQRDAKTIPWSAYASQARQRGVDVMTALEEGYPDLTVMLTFGPSLVLTKTENGKTPAEEAEYGLLVPFVAGMAEACKGKGRLVDGHEPSYGYRDPKRFDSALESIRLSTPKLEAGFGLWLDYDHAKHGWDVDHPDRNYFTPAAFGASLRAALERSDGIVWVYTETPRWWTKEGGPLKLPPTYVDAILRARRGLARD